MTRNGKIARLPKTIREQLNRRLDDNEEGKSLVHWLNSLPEVQALIASDFSGKPIREQNLSEWKKGGYPEWQKRQETLNWLRQLKEEAGDIAAVMDSREFNRHLAAVTAADLAQAMREIMEKISDPCERAEYLAQLTGRIALLRREESNAARTQIAQEKWDREVAKEEKYEKACGHLVPTRALLLQRMYIHSYGNPTMRAFLPEPAKASDAASFPAQSDSIRPGL